jgi:SM-20-related protein
MSVDASTIDAIADEVARRGWVRAPGFLEPREWRALGDQGRARWEEGDFRHAGVGRGADFRVRPEIRNDRVLWLDPAEGLGPERRYFERIEALRRALNERLYLGLFRFEAHYAAFPAGARYHRHLDRFRGAGHRIVTCLLYLNEAWRDTDSGALRLYTAAADEVAERFEDVLPIGGTLVVFLADRFEHEVLPARRLRMSLTGWLCRRD